MPARYPRGIRVGHGRARLIRALPGRDPIQVIRETARQVENCRRGQLCVVGSQRAGSIQRHADVRTLGCANNNRQKNNTGGNQAVPQSDTQATFDETVSIVRNAIPKMSEHKIPMTPANYAVWFAYLSESDQALRDEMDRLLQAQEPISQATMQELYDRYLKERDEQIASAKIALSRVVGALMSQIDEADGHYSDFSSELRDVAAGLDQGVTGDSLNDLIERAVQATNTALERGAAMKQKFSALAGEMQQMRGELARSQEEARADALTGLNNRLAFQETLGELGAFAEEDSHTPCMLLLDIDFFKRVNDTYGHLGGDVVLQAVAAKVRASVREHDIVARFGGEEFAVLMRDTPRSACMAVAETVRLQVAALAIALPEELGFSEPVAVTASLGGAWFREGESAETLVDRADRALYQSKENGRNRVSWEN